MAQADYSISNQGFPATRADINSHLQAIATNNSGTSAPSTQYAGQFWIDTTSSTWTLYIHDGADDIQFATIDTSANTVNFIDSELGDNSVTTAKIADGNVTSAKLSYPLTTFSSTGIDDNATSTAITIDSSENVGIGTASPDEKLNVVGNIRAEAFSTPKLQLKRTGNNAGNGYIECLGADDSVDYKIAFAESAGAMSFDVGASERMRIDSSGKVGIGTSSPSTTLDVVGDAKVTGDLTINDGNKIQLTKNTVSSGDSLGIIEFHDEDGATGANAGEFRIEATRGDDKDSPNLKFIGAGTAGVLEDRLVIAGSSGNIGIGTSSPSEKLEVSGNILIANNNALKINDTSSAKEILKVDNFNQTILKNANDSRDIIIRNAADTNLVTIDPTGDVSITGALSKGSGSFKIDHPLPSKNSTHYLVHSFTESPQADLIYRGKVDLVDGTATVNIDTAAGMTEGTFVLLNREIQCFTSNETGWTAVKGFISGNTLTITAQDNTCTDTISWMVIGERQDQHMYDTSWTDDNGKVIVEPLKVTETQP